jgi:hypothetical protein
MPTAPAFKMSGFQGRPWGRSLFRVPVADVPLRFAGAQDDYGPGESSGSGGAPSVTTVKPDIQSPPAQPASYGSRSTVASISSSDSSSDSDSGPPPPRKGKTRKPLALKGSFASPGDPTQSSTYSSTQSKVEGGAPSVVEVSDEEGVIRDERGSADPAEEAIEMVYGGETVSGRRQTENRRLRAQLAAERRERKRAREEGDSDEEAFTKRPRRDAPLGPAIDRATIQAVREMYSREAAYQAELESSPYVQFAIYVADQETPGTGRYRYLNNTFRNMLENLYSGASADSGRMVAAAASAMRMMGDTLRAFPGTAEELGGTEARESFARVYRDLADATEHMQRRSAILEEVRLLSRPSTAGALSTVISPELLMRAEQVIGTVRLLDNTSAHYPPPSLQSIIEDATGRMLLARAVTEASIMQRHRTSALPKSRMTTKLDVLSNTEATFNLARYLRQRSGSVPFGMSVGARYTPTGIPVNLGF